MQLSISVLFYGVIWQEMARYFMMVDSASVNSQDNAGWTPLHEACCSNHMKVAELLLKFEADANASATDGTRSVSLLVLLLKA